MVFVVFSRKCMNMKMLTREIFAEIINLPLDEVVTFEMQTFAILSALFPIKLPKAIMNLLLLHKILSFKQGRNKFC